MVRRQWKRWDGKKNKGDGKENEKEKEKREENMEVQKGTGEEMEQ